MIIYGRFYLIIIILGNLLLSSNFTFKDIPVQENGRIKPLDTFARNQLLSIYSKRSLKPPAFPENLDSKKLSAIDWFIDIALYPDDADKYRVFNIRNPEVVGSLGLIWDTNHLYNRNEILQGLQYQLDYIAKIPTLADEDITPFDQQMFHIYSNVIHFQELCFSFSCLIDLIEIEDKGIADAIGIKPGERISYYDVMKKANALNPHIENLTNKNKNEWTVSEEALSRVIFELNDIAQDKFAHLVKIIPPEDILSKEKWLSPWELMDNRQIGIKQQQFLNILSNYLNARLNGEESLANNMLAEYKEALVPYQTIFKINLLENETWYNNANLFIKSTALYILAFFLLAISWMSQPLIIRKISFACLLIGLAFHVYGICLRIIIMQRPPISTLYESVIFVNLIGVICAVLLEYNRKDGMGILMGTICGVILHYIGFGYANDGDTLGILVAVLNSNFWLATHVTTITTGYGTSLFAGLLGHVYLFQVIRDPSNAKYLKTINGNMFGATIFALFFTLFGTILGGIWADQSWGRFWGWDPKENGALLIVMWQIMMIHMRISGYVKPTGFALGMIMNNIIVVLAWFGVNLLGVGLHSYGFASGIAKNLVIFIIFELVIGFGIYYWAICRKNNLIRAI